jgi:hypothetical protein
MREKIAEIVFDKLGAAFHGNTGNIFALELADAIVAGLADTIPPLVWEAGDGITASREYLSADAGMGVTYCICDGELTCSFDKDTFNEVWFDLDADAKAAANSHLCDTIIEKFKGEKT